MHTLKCWNQANLKMLKKFFVRETKYIRENNVVNVNIPCRTKKEWYKENADYVKEKRKEYVDANKEYIKQWKKEYHIKNKDELNKKGKLYRENNEDKIKMISKDYYQKNKDAIIERSKKNAEKNVKHRKQYAKEYAQKNKEKIQDRNSIKILCECGKLITKNKKNRHDQTIAHIQYINNITINGGVLNINNA